MTRPVTDNPRTGAVPVYVKAVPDARPNDNGRWTTVYADPERLGSLLFRGSETRWEYLSSLLPDGEHAVSARTRPPEAWE